MKEEIRQEYINFLNDTKKQHNIKSWEEFKKEYVVWFVEMFGISDGRTQEIIEELNNYKFDDIKLDYFKLTEEYNKIEKLRKNIDMDKYNKLKEINKNDALYSWAFQNGDVLYETLEDLKSEYYHQKYIHDIGLTYIEILENCQKDKKRGGKNE